MPQPTSARQGPAMPANLVHRRMRRGFALLVVIGALPVVATLAVAGVRSASMAAEHVPDAYRAGQVAELLRIDGAGDIHEHGLVIVDDHDGHTGHSIVFYPHVDSDPAVVIGNVHGT